MQLVQEIYQRQQNKEIFKNIIENSLSIITVLESSVTVEKSADITIPLTGKNAVQAKTG